MLRSKRMQCMLCATNAVPSFSRCEHLKLSPILLSYHLISLAGWTDVYLRVLSCASLAGMPSLSLPFLSCVSSYLEKRYGVACLVPVFTPVTVVR